MVTKTLAKQERVIESVRLGLLNEEAVEFVHTCGYAITRKSVDRYIQAMGGLERVQALIEEGNSNIDILEICFPSSNTTELKAHTPTMSEHLVTGSSPIEPLLRPDDIPLYDTAKVTIHLPADVYEAIRLASHAEGKSQQQVIVEMLTFALSQLPRPDQV